MPLLCPGGFDTCTTSLEARERFRKNNTDVPLYHRSPLLPSNATLSLGRFTWLFLANS